MYNNELESYLLENGASKVGFADLSTIKETQFKSGVSIMIKLRKNIVNSISDGPNLEYYEEYHRLNAKLNDLAQLGTEFIKSHGYHAIAQTTDYVQVIGNYETNLPHKTVATLAGLGWIGKSALLVTKEFGTAILLTSIVTNMEFDYGKPITKSIFGDCTTCEDACLGNAISGKLWQKDMHRDKFFDASKCRKTARKISKEQLNKEISLCGKCIQICPYTQKYLKYAQYV